jgi:hypothetical protein
LVSGMRFRTCNSPDDGVRLYLNWPDGGKEKELTTQITGASRGEDSALFYAFITALCLFMKLLYMYMYAKKKTQFLLVIELLLVKESNETLVSNSNKKIYCTVD